MDLKEINENIIQEFCAGHEKAFRILYEKYAPALRYFAARYIDEEEVIDDIIQDVFVGLWERHTTFKTENALKSFLYISAKNGCLNLIRHQGVKTRYAKVANWDESEESFLEHILEAEIFELLQEVFNELPPTCREVYRLSLEGKKHEEIARELNITINTVKKHKNNANHYMRERLKNILLLLIFLG